MQLSGSLPLAMFVQVPEPQLWQVPQELLAQQLPSTQLPEVHSPPALQLSPRAFLPQVPPVQTFPAVHWSLSVQLVRQAEPSHRKVPQEWVAPAEQAPAPLQVRASVSVDPEHDCGAHSTPEACFRHAPAALHLPSLPQVEAGSGEHPPCGSSAPFATFAHTPLALPQLLHVPHEAVEQQVPSTQLPEPHSLAALQLAPSAFLPHTPSMHWFGATHCEGTVHELKQSVPPLLQVNGAQARLVPATQMPVPLHDPAEVALPPLHDAAVQVVPEAYLRHMPLPSQLPSLPQLPRPWSAQPPRGSGDPAATAEQVPALPVWLQEKQLDVQAVEQQTPWAQKLLRHSSAREQTAPGGFLPHEPFTQVLGATQSELVEQALPQRLPLHLKGVHREVAGVTQRPSLQVLCWV